jgi:hypothetical protein
MPRARHHDIHPGEQLVNAFRQRGLMLLPSQRQGLGRFENGLKMN